MIAKDKVRNWVRKFIGGKVGVHDGPRSGVHSILTNEVLAKVKYFFREDRRLTLDELYALILELSRSMIHEAVTEKSGQKKRPGQIRLLKVLEGFGWDMLTHLPDSPDLAHSDCRLFIKLKEVLRGKRHENDNEEKLAVLNRGKGEERNFFKEEIHKLVNGYDKFIERHGGK